MTKLLRARSGMYSSCLLRVAWRRLGAQLSGHVLTLARKLLAPLAMVDRRQL